MADRKKEETKTNDDELDELLDNALEDFDKVAIKSDEPGKTTTSGSEEVEDPPMETLWNDEFIAQQAKMFEKQMADIFSASGGDGAEISPEQISLGFQRIAEAASIAIDPNQSANVASDIDPAFTESIKNVLKGLADGQQNLQQPFNSEDVAGMFGNINLNESGDTNAFLPFMQGMMQSLLSAEVLLPSLKELSSKYPTWLEENASKISAEEKERYESQLKLMKEVCDELEKEKADDSANVKKERFNKVLESMQQMQALGSLPEEILGEGGNNPDLPNFSNLAGDGTMNNEQCSIM